MARGRGDDREASLVMGNSFVLSVITGFLLMIIVLVFNKPILYAFGASDSTYGYAKEYLEIYALGSIPVLVTLSMTAFGFCRCWYDYCPDRSGAEYNP